MRKYIIALLVLCASISQILAQSNQKWSYYTDNRARFRVVSPLGQDAPMRSHFVGLQVDTALLANDRRGFRLVQSGLRRDTKTGKLAVFEAIFEDGRKTGKPYKIPVRLLVYDVVSPNQPVAQYDAVFMGVKPSSGDEKFACQIPITQELDASNGLVLVAMEPPVPLASTEARKTPSTYGPWAEDGDKEIFIYAPVPGYDDYGGGFGEAVEEVQIVEKPMPAREKTDRKPLKPGYTYNTYGFPITEQQAQWSGHREARDFYDRATKKYGMKSPNGSVLIPAQYERIHYQYCGFMLATKEGKSGVVNEANEVVIPFEYNHLEIIYIQDYTKIPDVTLTEMRLLAKKADKIGIIDGLGHVISPLVEASNGNIYYYYKAERTSRGDIIRPLGNYQDVLRHSALMLSGANGGVLDGNGREVLPLGEFSSALPIYSGPANMISVANKDGKYGLFDLIKQAWVLPMSYIVAPEYYHHMRDLDYPNTPRHWVVTEAEEYGNYKKRLVDSLGNTINATGYDDIWFAFPKNGNWNYWAEQGGKWGAFDDAGVETIQFRHGKATDCFVLGDKLLFMVQNDAGVGLIDSDGNQLMPYEKEAYYFDHNGKLIIYRNGSKLHGLLDSDGKDVVPATYAGIYLLGKGFFSVTNADNLVGVADANGNIIHAPAYKAVYPPEHIGAFFGPKIKAKGLDFAKIVAVLGSLESAVALLEDGSIVPL